MTRRLAAALSLLLALSAACVAAPADLSLQSSLDLSEFDWQFEDGGDRASRLERTVSGDRVITAVRLPGALETSAGSGTLRLSVQIADVHESLRPFLSTQLVIGNVGGADEIRFNGQPIGSTSGMAISETGLPRRYTVPSRLIRFGGINEIEIHIRGQGGAEEIPVGGPITLAALGAFDLWDRVEAIRGRLQTIAQSLWTAEVSGVGDLDRVVEMWERHRLLIVTLISAERDLAEGRLRIASSTLDECETLLNDLGGDVGPLRLAIRDLRAQRRSSLGQHFEAMLPQVVSDPEADLRQAPDGFGRFGLWLHDGTPYLSSVSPTEIRGAGQMGWHIAVDHLLATEVVDLSWVSKTSLVVGVRNEEPCDYTVSASVPFPGVMIEQRAGDVLVLEVGAPITELTLQGVEEQRDRSGLRLSPTWRRCAALVVARKAERETIWMLAAAQPFSDVQLEPNGVNTTRLTLTFPRRTPARLILSPVHGIALRSTREIDEASIAAIEELLPVIQYFPLWLDEFYAIDRSAGEVVLFDHWQHRPLAPREATAAEYPVWLPPLLKRCEEAGQSISWHREIREIATLSSQGPALISMHPQAESVVGIPLPSLGGRFHVRPSNHGETVDLLNRNLTDLGMPTMPNAVDRTYKGRTQGYHAWMLLSEENRTRLTANSLRMIPLTFDPAIWHEWTEPLSDETVWHTYTIEGPAFDLYDQEWGNGLPLYALSTWAMIEEGWDLLAENRGTIDQMWAWWQVTQDWAWMRSSNAFHGHGTGAGDCSCADYAGALGRARIMEALGDEPARDEALWALARSALSISSRFGLTHWARDHGLIGAQDVAIGFHEGGDYLSGSVEAYPWNVTSMISGNGIQPEIHDMLLERVPDLYRQYEEELLTANPTLFDGEADYSHPTLYRGNSGYITLPHIYAQARLGADHDQLIEWIDAARPNEYLWWQAPTTLAEIAGRDTGFWVENWTRATLRDGWAEADGTVHVQFEATHPPLRWEAHCDVQPERVLISGHDLGHWTWNEENQRLTVETDLTGFLEFTVERER